MTDSQKEINGFLVNVFNDILRLEENSIAHGEFSCLSVSEMHVIEAVCIANENCTNTMAEMAASLNVTASTLTIAVKTLEQKGYLLRTRCSKDKRRVLVTPTEIALRANENHLDFHKKLVDSLTTSLTSEEIDTLSTALVKLHGFFSSI